MADIHAVTVPKWGLSMDKGTVVAWHKQPGDRVRRGDDLVDVESDKIANVVECPFDGFLRRQVAAVGDVLPVGALLGVVADAEVPDASVDALVAEFQANFKPIEAAAGGGPQPQVVQVRGRRVRYLAMGEGEDALLLIHGFGGDLNSWLFNQEPLAEGRRVYALDLPGHGESDKRLETGSLEEYAACVTGLMDAIDLGAAHLVGHSMGAAVALSIAAAAPARVRSLTLVCPAGLGTEINDDYLRGFAAANSRSALKPMLAQLFANQALVNRQLVDDVLRYKRLEGVTAALDRTIAAQFADGRQRTLLRDVVDRFPAQVIWGAEDRIIPPRHAEGLPAGVPVHRLAGAGHMAHMEAAAQVNRLIAALVAKAATWSSSP
jgi:pyruvate dehydrogenase E2 component (dihydrolipoamide acetyltransferase)